MAVENIIHNRWRSLAIIGCQLDNTHLPLPQKNMQLFERASRNASCPEISEYFRKERKRVKKGYNDYLIAIVVLLMAVFMIVISRVP
jgi:hypothetical protein